MRKPLIAVLATASTLFAAGAANAGGDVQWSVGINLPNVATVISNFPVPVLPSVSVRHAPVVYAPVPQIVVHEPRVVYERQVVVRQPVVVHQPVQVAHGRWAAPVEYRRGWDRDGDGIPNRYDRVDNRKYGPYGDIDRDGKPNRFDRVDNRYRGDREDRRGDWREDRKDDRRDDRDDRKHRH